MENALGMDGTLRPTRREHCCAKCPASVGMSSTRSRNGGIVIGKTGRFVVQQERQVVEGDDRVQLIGQHLEQLGHGFVAGKRLRDGQQRVVARELS